MYTKLEETDGRACEYLSHFLKPCDFVIYKLLIVILQLKLLICY